MRKFLQLDLLSVVQRNTKSERQAVSLVTLNSILKYHTFSNKNGKGRGLLFFAASFPSVTNGDRAIISDSALLCR